MTEAPIDRTPKGKVSPPDPVTLSWSGLKRWENCPQHQLRVILKQTERQEKGRIFLPGTVCDLAQRRWLESDNPQPGEMAQFIEDIFTETVEKGESVIKWKGNPITDQNNVKKFCRETVESLEPWLMEHVLPYGYAPEVKFRAHMEVPYICEDAFGPVKLIGGIDVVVQDDQGKFRLYDLKVTTNADYIRSTLAQLTFYDIAWGVIQGDFQQTVDWGFITPALPDQKFIPVDIDRDARQVMMSRIVKYAQGVWRDNWDPKSDDVGCNWCEAKPKCDKFNVLPIADENGKMKVSFAQAFDQKRKFKTDS